MNFNDTIEDDGATLVPRTQLEVDQDPVFDPHAAKSGLKSAFFNMTNSIVGAGIVGIPAAFRNSGLLAGLILMTVLTYVNDWTLRLIIVNTKLSGSKTYTGFVTHSFGTKGKIIVLLSQGLFAFGGAVGFSVIIGDSIPHVLRSVFSDAVENHPFWDFMLSRNIIIIFSVVFISYPLSLIRDMSKLAKTSGLALISMIIIIVIVVTRSLTVSDDLRGTISGTDWFISLKFFQGISVISFALVCHHNTTFIYDSIKIPTLDRFNQVTHVACIISGFVCALMGLTGFLNFGSMTKGNILNNFPSDDWVVNIARLCFGLNMLTTFPLEIFVFREVFKDLIIIYHQREDPEYQMEHLPTSYHFIITTFSSLIPMIISLFTCNLGAVLELVGATSGSTLAYILPPLCYYKMTWRNKSIYEKVPIFACIIFGFLVMFISSFQTIMQSFSGGGEGGHCVS